MANYNIDSYVVVDKNNHIVTMDSGMACERMARQWNKDPEFRSDCKPFRAVHVSATFNS